MNLELANLARLVDLVVRNPVGSGTLPVPTSPALGSQVCTDVSSFSCGFWGSKLRSSSWCGKTLYRVGLLPSLGELWSVLC